jgi:hypothetical protein
MACAYFWRAYGEITPIPVESSSILEAPSFFVRFVSLTPKIKLVRRVTAKQAERASKVYELIVCWEPATLEKKYGLGNLLLEEYGGGLPTYTGKV